MTGPHLDVESVRSSFPALENPQVFFDNAGGSQILGEVAESIKDYLVTNNVQLGATYKSSEQSTDAYYAGLKAAAEYINAEPDEIVIGPSTTQLFRNLSTSLWPLLASNGPAEIVISTVDHEANIASWSYLATHLPNVTLKWWTPTDSKTNPHLTPESLKPLLSPRTRLVTCTHTSNILGTVTDIRAVADAVHTIPGALLCVDGVAFAPHRPLDVKALDVDFYGFSWYKVYGPHIAQLYCARRAQDSAMTSLGHFFKKGWALEDKLGLAAASYELVQSLPRVTAYLRRTGWDAIVAQEVAITEPLLAYLRGKPDVFRIWGEPDADAARRVPVVSFTVNGRDSKEVVEALERNSDFGFRWGHFYSLRLVGDLLGLDRDTGVVRVSMVHYNTVGEVEAFVKAFDKVVCGG